MEALNRQVLNNESINTDDSKYNFDVLLDQYGIPYRIDNLYLYSGAAPESSDLELYISVILTQIPEALNRVLPFLLKYDLSFKLVRNELVVNNLFSGNFGYNNIGKILTFYVPADQNTSARIQNLVGMTADLSSPAIPGHISLGGALYSKADDDKGKATVKTGKSRILKERYVILFTIKDDFKGSVLYAYSFSGIQVKKVVIKSGLRFMLSDKYGRDIKDRLEWQYKIHQKLSGVVNMPKAIDLFEENGATYFVTQFIKGQTLHEIINNAFKNRCWLDLPLETKADLAKILIDIIDLVEVMHKRHYVHRDLNPVNFIRSRDGKVYVIDCELAYHTRSNHPDPPFQLGTEGYMSPEQRAGAIPTEAEDIYAVGALLFLFFTNMPITKFELNVPGRISEIMMFFTGDVNASILVEQCLGESPQVRPELIEIREVLTLSFDSGLGDLTVRNTDEPEHWPSAAQVTNSIWHAFEGLAVSKLADSNEFFNVRGDYNSNLGHRLILGEGIGLTTAIGGIIQLIYHADPSDYPLKHNKFLKDFFSAFDILSVAELTGSSSGLFCGAPGCAVTLQYAIHMGYLPAVKKYKDFIGRCFDSLPDSLDFANGIAGHAYAALLIYQADGGTFFLDKLNDHLDLLLKNQQKDGSWHTGVATNVKSKPKPGFAYGVSGIVFTLIKCYALYPRADLKPAVERGMVWLHRKSKLNNSGLFKIPDAKRNLTFINGDAGIALVFLYAFESFGNERYKHFAEKLLLQFGEFPVHRDYSLDVGLTGTALVYAEAARICNSPLWKKKSSWIYEVLMHTFLTKKEGEITWDIGGFKNIDTTLLTGSGGIILFLLKFRQSLARV